jgi:hemoglobin-like flavoprotein
MTPAQTATIRRQFGQIAPRKEEFAALFYDRLFDGDPTIRPMFPADMRPQRVKLVQALAHIILSLDNLDAVIGDVRELGMRHVGYGVRPDHYNAVGEALLATLAEMLGDSFDDFAQAAWALAYGIIADAMVEAGADMAIAAE